MVAVRPTSAQSRVLVVEPESVAALKLRNALAEDGFDVRAAGDAVTGLRTMAAVEPQVLIVELEMSERDGSWLLRRMRDDYMGRRPHVIVLGRPEAIAKGLVGLTADAVVLRPAHEEAVVAAAATLAEASDRGGDRETVRKLLKLTLLSGDMSSALRTMGEQLSRAFRTHDCVLVATIGEREYVSAATGQIPRTDDRFWATARVALDAEAPVLASAPDGSVSSYYSVPLQTPGGPRLGVLILRDNRPRVFPAAAMSWLRDLGARLYTELTWRSVHERIAADRDRLRESSMLDPMLGIWTRETLEQSLPAEVSTCQQRQEPMTFATLDIVGLKHVNDRFGHMAGDAVIRHVAGIIDRKLRPQDLIARHAGNTFAVVMTSTQFEDGLKLIKRVQEAVIASPLETDNERIAVELAVGITPLLGEADTGEAALSRAVGAAHFAKKKGQRLVVADAETQAEEDADQASYEGFEAGTTVGGMYQILHEISRGAMGVVYRAEDLGLGRPVALKTLRPDLVKDRNLVDLFRREATTLAKLRHENLVQVYTFGIYDENAYFVMELVEGEPIENLIEREWRLDRHVPLELVEKTITQIADALDAMHRAGVLHRDVKPTNVLLDRARDRAVLVDFGIAKPAGAGYEPAGTPGYAAPEVFQGGRENQAADVYGLAATAYMLLCSVPPYDDDSVAATLARQATSPPPAPTSMRTRLPAEVDSVLLRALDPEPSNRYSSAGDFAQAIVRALQTAEPDIRAGDDTVMDTPAHTAFDSTKPAITSELEIPEERAPGEAEAEVTPSPVPVLSPSDIAPSEPGHERKRASTLIGVPFQELPSSPAEIALTRGALFRAAHRLLGPKRASSPIPIAPPKKATIVGAGWVAKVAASDVTLAEALGPSGNNLSWHPTAAFVNLLEAMAKDKQDAHEFARSLGRIAATSTFSRFYGADPRARPLGEVLAAANVFWHRYHSWGVVTVDQTGEGSVDFVISDSPRNEYLCSSTIGILEQIATLAGVRDAEVSHLACEAQGDDACVFEVTWEPRERATGRFRTPPDPRSTPE